MRFPNSFFSPFSCWMCIKETNFLLGLYIFWKLYISASKRISYFVCITFLRESAFLVYISWTLWATKHILPLLASLFEELSDLSTNSPDFIENTDISKKKSAVEKNAPFWKVQKNFFMDLKFGRYVNDFLKFSVKNAHATSSNWPRFNCAIFVK